MPELHLRVFISSPGDVADERAAARQVLTYLPKEYVFRNRVLIEEVSWDDPGAPVPMDAHLTPQDAINQHRPKPSQCDIVGVILWSRMGTPLPPTIQKPDGTPYLSGTEWEFLDAVTSAEQTGRPTTLVYRRLEEPQVGLDDPDQDSKTQQYKAVKAFFNGFRNPDGSLRRSYQTYRTTSEFQDLLERGLRELISARLDTLPKNEPANEKVNQGALTQPTDMAKDIAWQGSPYRGLEPFREEHAPIFFGRGKETDELVKRFTNPTPRVMAVIGASGSGKSSLVSAGLIPRLKAGAVPGSAQWVTVRFTPAESGDNPFLSIIQRLLPHLAGNTEPATHLASTLQTNPTSIETLANQALKTKPSTAELLVFADQFEELFTSRVNEAYQAPFIALVDTICPVTPPTACLDPPRGLLRALH
jgi:hypothetical protein